MPNGWFLNAPLLPVPDFHKFLNEMFVPQVGQWLKNSKMDGNCAMQCVVSCINESIQWFEFLRIFQKMGVIWFIIPPLHSNFAWCTFFHFRGENLHLDLDGILFLGGVRTTMYGNLPSQIVSKHGYKASILIICLHFWPWESSLAVLGITLMVRMGQHFSKILLMLLKVMLRSYLLLQCNYKDILR